MTTSLTAAPALPALSRPVVGSKRATAPVKRVLSLTVVDQAASSISNFSLALIIAHYSDSRGLGIFALLTTMYILAQGLVRSMSSDCLLTRSETDDTFMATFEHAGYLFAFMSSVLLSVLLALAAMFMSHGFAVPVLIFAASFPFMAMQDFSRYIGISRHDPAYAIKLDVSWLVVFVGAFVWLRAEHLVTLPWLWGAWTASGALVGLWTARRNLTVRTSPSLVAIWVRSERAVGVRFAGQFMLSTSWLYIIFYLLVFVMSIEAVGQVKLAQLAITPLIVVSSGLQAGLISISAKRFRRDKTSAFRFLLVAGIALGGATALWTLAMSVAPLHVMTTFYGHSWAKARPFVPFIGLGFACSVFASVGNAGLRAIRAAKAYLRLALIMVPFFFIPTMGGAALGGPKGFSYGLVAAMGVYAVAAWSVFSRTVAHLDSGGLSLELGSDPVPAALVVQQEPATTARVKNRFRD